MEPTKIETTTPELQGSKFCAQSSGDPCTPTNPPRHRILDSLSTTGECRTPSLLKIPASPALQRLGYGTGIGVFLLERSPRASGEIRSPWAIKKLTQMKNRSSYESRLEHEANILKALSHPNIVGYRAFVKPSPLSDKSFLAMEKASASLADLCEVRCDEAGIRGDCEPFPAAQINKVGEDVAKALVYLHDEKKILHGDVKSANVLIFGDFETVKLCDFGVSRFIKDDGTLEGEYVGTEVWTPMEVIRKTRGLPHEPITNKADIFAYGLTLFEMLSCKTPHLPTADYPCTEGGTELDDVSFDEEAFEENLAQVVGTRPYLPDVDFDESYNNILALFFCCTEEIPSKRPDAKDILQVFTSPALPKLNLSQAEDDSSDEDVSS